jgi:hypothetical protein
MDAVRILVGKIFDGHGHTVEDMVLPISDVDMEYPTCLRVIRGSHIE